MTARRLAVEALTRAGTSTEIAAALTEAVEAARQIQVGDGPIGLYRSAYSMLLEILEQLYRWDSAIQIAEPDSDRFLRAAWRQAEVLTHSLGTEDPQHAPVLAVLQNVMSISTPEALGPMRAQVASVPLPLQLIASPPETRFPRTTQRETADPNPRVVVLLELDGQPLSGPVLVDVHRAYPLQVDARVLHWPDWANRLQVRFLSQWQGSAATVRDVQLNRPPTESDGIWRATTESGVVVHAASADPERPMQFTLEAEMIGDDRREPVEVLGYSDIALLTYDPALDYVTGSEVIDRRVYEVLRHVNSSGVPEAERKAFSDLFKALANEAQKLVANNTFREGVNVLEADFQARLRDGAQSRLGASNVRTGAEVGGGRMDLVYLDSLTAELKVERATAATVENAARYLGQPAQYGAGGGRQLSILCVLDITQRDAPVGVLANGIGLLKPRLSGHEDARFPSLIGVIIVRAGLPLPSDWSGTTIPTG